MKKLMNRRKYRENKELMEAKRKMKVEQDETIKERARESQEDTMKNLEKKEFDKERQKRLLADKCK